MFIGSNSSFLRLHAPAAPTHAAHAGSMQKLCDHLCAEDLPVYNLPASSGALHECREQVCLSFLFFFLFIFFLNFILFFKLYIIVLVPHSTALDIRNSSETFGSDLSIMMMIIMTTIVKES